MKPEEREKAERIEGLDMLKKKVVTVSYDKENLRPVIRASICNGEQVAGFKNIHTGKFSEVMSIKSEKDMEEFLGKYGIMREDVRREY